MEYPVKFHSNHKGECEYILKRYSKQQAGPHGAGREERRVVCAGPRFIRCERVKNQDSIVTLTCAWSANYSRRTLKGLLAGDVTFGPDAEFIEITPPDCKWLIQLTFHTHKLVLTHFGLMTAHLECKVWPSGNPLDRLLWQRPNPQPDPRSNLPPPPPPQQSAWHLQIPLRNMHGQNTGLFNSLLGFDLNASPQQLVEHFSRYYPAAREQWTAIWKPQPVEPPV